MLKGLFDCRSGQTMSCVQLSINKNVVFLNIFPFFWNCVPECLHLTQGSKIEWCARLWANRWQRLCFQWRSNWSLSNAAILLPKESICHGFYDPVICVLGFHVASRVICVVLPLAKFWLQWVPRWDNLGRLTQQVSSQWRVQRELTSGSPLPWPQRSLTGFGHVMHRHCIFHLASRVACYLVRCGILGGFVQLVRGQSLGVWAHHWLLTATSPILVFLACKCRPDAVVAKNQVVSEEIHHQVEMDMARTVATDKPRHKTAVS